MKKISKRFAKGFSIIEIIVVIVIIGVLSTVAVVSYGGISKKVAKVSLEADLQKMSSKQLNFKMSNGSTGKPYYSTAGFDTDLNFKPSDNNIIDVVTGPTGGYCARAYNPKSEYDSIYNALTSELNLGDCNKYAPSPEAAADYTGPKIWTQVSVGYNHVCAVNSVDSRVYCWGQNDCADLGDNTIINKNTPTPAYWSGIMSGKTVNKVNAGGCRTLVIADNNQLYGWGEDDNGELGDDAGLDFPAVPVEIVTTGALSGKTILDVANGGNDTCAIASDNQVYCWGYNNDGQLGDGTIVDKYYPNAVNTSGVLAGKTIKDVSVGYAHVCVLASDNQVYCWGNNSYGQLGDNSIARSLVPVPVDTTGILQGKTIKSISVEWHTSCAIASDNQAYCWGRNDNKQLGDGTNISKQVPVAVINTGVLSGKTIKYIDAGVDHTCAIASDDNIYCWGGDWVGQLGQTILNTSGVPVAVTTTGVLSGKTIKSLSVGNNMSCVIASDNNIYCWGRGQQGQMGNGTNAITNSSPVLTQLAP